MQTSRSSKTRYSIVGAEKSVDQNCLVRFLEDKVFATTDYHLQNYFTSDGLTRLIKLMGGPQKPGVMKALGSSFVESKLVAFLSSLKHEEVLCKEMNLFEFRLRKKTSF